MYEKRTSNMEEVGRRQTKSSTNWKKMDKIINSTIKKEIGAKELTVDGKRKRMKRFELSTLSLARRCSTTELHPQRRQEAPAKKLCHPGPNVSRG